MLKLKGKAFWFVVFLIQLVLAVLVPTTVLLLSPAQYEPISMEISGLVFDKAEPNEVKDVLSRRYQSIVDNKQVILKSGDRQIQIPYSRLEIQIDGSRIYNEVEKKPYNNLFFQLIKKNNRSLSVLKPDIFINEARYRDTFTEFLDFFRVDAKNASLVLQQGALAVIPHIDGLEFNIEKALDYIKEQLETDVSKDIIISANTTPELFHVSKPDITTGQLQRYTQIYSRVDGKIPDDKTEKFEKLVESLKNKVIYPDQAFSFKERMSDFSEDDPLQVLLASIIYQAILPLEDIKVTWRKAANQPITGIQPGLEASIDDGGDLQFINASEKELILIIDVEHSGRWTALLAGEPGLRFGMIKTEYSKIPVPEVYLQDSTLPKNSVKVTEQGREGLSVKVYRLINGETTELYEDIYQPVSRVIATGTEIKAGAAMPK